MRTVTSICLLLGAIACTGSPHADSGNVEETGLSRDTICSETSTLCLSLGIPEDHTGTPRNLFVGLVDSLPPAGPPNIYLFEEDDPDINAGESMFLALNEDVPDTGEYYVYSVLYDINGGEWVPKLGVDYVATSESSYSFNGQGIDIGSIQFALYSDE